MTKITLKDHEYSVEMNPSLFIRLSDDLQDKRIWKPNISADGNSFLDEIYYDLSLLSKIAWSMFKDSVKQIMTREEFLKHLTYKDYAEIRVGFLNELIALHEGLGQNSIAALIKKSMEVEELTNKRIVDDLGKATAKDIVDSMFKDNELKYEQVALRDNEDLPYIVSDDVSDVQESVAPDISID